MVASLSRRIFLVGLLAACGRREAEAEVTQRDTFDPPLFPNETPELRALINKWADFYEIPRELVHKQAVRESTHRPWAVARPYYGLLQILPATARSMGFKGEPKDLLDADTNLEFAGKYLRGAWLVSDGDIDTAVQWYARGFYFEAKRRGLLVETGLKQE